MAWLSNLGGAKRRRLGGLWIVALALVLSRARAASAEESPGGGAEPPILSLYTMSAGESLFSRWGHAAMCVHHPRSPRRDTCFNYGTADFQSPAPLTWQFLRGRADFWVARSTPREMLLLYRALDRTVWRQDLPLSSDEARAIERRLMEESRPENAHFLYDHFRENCSTRLRDIIDEETGGRLRRGSEHAIGRTYRDAARAGAADVTWLLLLTDLVLGRRADREMTAWQAMFLPRTLREEVRRRFGAAPTIVYQRRGRRLPDEPGLGGRGWVVLAAVLLSAIVALVTRRARRRRVARLIAGVPLGLIALLPWALAVVSTVPDLRENEALLVFCPLDAVALALPDRWARTWLLARLAVLGLTTLGTIFGVLRQPLWPLLALAALPLLATLTPRAPRGKLNEQGTRR